MKPQKILFFADHLPPLIGGMEIHAGYFIEYFRHHPYFSLTGIITKNPDNQDCRIQSQTLIPVKILDLQKYFSPSIVFFNSGCWIEEFNKIKNIFPDAIFFYRTGGNEISKAGLIKNFNTDHSVRQSYWANTINDCIDKLITNSLYTENRLQKMGITCPFARCVGGVNTAILKNIRKNPVSEIIIFCAARFVPYKNHALLVSIVCLLINRGYNIQLRLAGDGPLFNKIKEQVLSGNIDSSVKFLGILNHEKTCQEISQAHIYMQFSIDLLTNVPGGAYIHSEGMGRSILEALTAGTFVVAINSGALSEIVVAERGLLLKLENLKTMADKIEKVLQNIPYSLPKIEIFSWGKIFERYEKLFEAVP